MSIRMARNPKIGFYNLDKLSYSNIVDMKCREPG